MTYDARYDWKLRHRTALQHPHNPMESGIGRFMEAVEELVEAIGTEPDAVSTPAFGQILGGFRTLLNYELGRLDAGTLDAWAFDLARSIGWDADVENIRWDAAGDGSADWDDLEDDDAEEADNE